MKTTLTLFLSKKRNNINVPTEKNSHEYTKSSRMSGSQEIFGLSPGKKAYILIGC